ncbi:unnamed protein product [Victoria cruziana]
MSCPKLMIRFLPVPVVEWVGNVTVRCPDSGLEATMSFKGQSFLGFGGNRAVKGKIIDSFTRKPIYELDGRWDRVITKKEVDTGKVSTLYDAREALAAMGTPMLKDVKGLQPTESCLVWSEVSRAILENDWERAREAKKTIEERERRSQGESKSKGISWSPRYFDVVKTKDNEWDCFPKRPLVAAAPIVVSP